MRFNKSAFTTGFFLLLLFNLVFAGIIFIIIDEFNLQFQETHFLIIWLLLVPPLLYNILWLFCVIKYFSNGTNLKNKRFAKPSGTVDNSGFNKLEIINHKTKTNFLIGSIIALILSSYAYYKAYDSFFDFSMNRLLGQDKVGIRAIATPVFTDFSTRLEKYLSEEVITPDAKSMNAGSWQNVFTSDLKCFAPEKKIYDDLKAKLIEDKIPMKIIVRNGNIIEVPDNRFRNTQSHVDIELIHNFEYWIDPGDPNHFKLRFKTRGLSTFNNWRMITGFAYDYNSQSFIEQSSVESWLMAVGYFVYDSNIDEMRFEYSRSSENFIENHKDIFYSIWFVFVTLMGIGTFLILKILSTTKTLHGQKKFVRSRKVIPKPVERHEEL